MSGPVHCRGRARPGARATVVSSTQPFRQIRLVPGRRQPAAHREVSVLDRAFELVFKYRLVVFQQGDLSISPPWPAAFPALLLLAGLAAAGWSYAHGRRAAPPRVGALLFALRAATFALLALALLRPVLVVRAIEPQRNVLAVVIDDSRSMAIADRGAAPRHAFVGDALGANGPLRTALAERFTLKLLRFAGSTERMADVREASFDGTRSLLAPALQRTAEELAGLPASGIVLVTDGADTSRAPVADTIRSLRASGLPVFAIGVGAESLDRDIQIGRVDPPTSVLAGATLVVDVLVGQTGYAGRTVPLIVEDEGRVIATEQVALPRDGEPSTVRVRFTLEEAGPRVIGFRIPPQDREQVTQNNAREALISVESRRERVLYIEGEPRPEMKFLRQAVAGDRNLQVVTLQRTAQRKFLRLDLDHAEELAGGFPATREELFRYRGLILGSIEAAAFTPDQLRMMADFVSLRGGGLIALGGRHAYAEGGYAGTPVAEALPVRLDSAQAPAPVLAIDVRPTLAGRSHAVTQVADTEATSLARWAALPQVTVVNPLRLAKPGAAVLLEGTAPGGGAQVVLAYQRFGAGKAIALGVQDTWLWQMHADVPVEDLTHETLWRRLLRWLVDGVPERVAAGVDRDRVEPGEVVTITATVRDDRFVGVNNADVRARVIGPSGPPQDLPLAFVIDRDGQYRARYTATGQGLHEIRIQATTGGTPLGGARAYVRTAPDDGEYFDPAMRTSLLTRFAEDTGGRFYTPATASTLPDDITYLGRGITIEQEKDLWDMPIVLLLLVGLMAAEWFARRRWGLP